MKILAISTWFPYPPDNGSKTRAYNLLRHLGARHTLDLLALSQTDRDMDYLDRLWGFCRRCHAVPEPRFDPSGIRSWTGFFSPTPRYFREHHAPEIEDIAARWASEERYDAVVAVTLGAAPYAVKLNVPFKLLDQHNVESEVIKRKWRSGRGMLRRLRWLPTWLKSQRFERKIASCFDAIAVVSERERELMELMLRDGRVPKVAVVPNGVDPSLLSYRPRAKESGVFAFTGALTYAPNYDAATCLCRDILPALRTRFGDVRLRITGSTDGVDLSEFSGARGVEFTGYVDDIRPVVSSAWALVVPLRYGGGTRVKILEAMALGTPVVSTPMGAEGLDVIDGTHILLGDDVAELVEQTTRLLADPGLAARIADNARELVRERYQWPSIAERFEGLLVSIREMEVARNARD